MARSTLSAKMPVSRSNISRFAFSVADKRASGHVFTQLLQMVLINVHRPLRVLIFHDGVTASRELS
jgi:hypothetical protein